MKKYYIYEMKLLSLNLFSLILFALIVIVSFVIDKTLLLKSIIIEDYYDFILQMILYMCFHEVIHSITYVVYGAKYKNIIYGASLEKGILYCLCKQNITKKNILHSLLSPLILLGIATYIISVIYNLPRLLLLSILNITGCSGDIIMYMFIKMQNNIEFSEFDSPNEFALYTKEDISSKKPFGLKFLHCKKDIKREDYKKIQISKTSIGIFIILSIFALIINIIE